MDSSKFYPSRAMFLFIDFYPWLIIQIIKRVLRHFPKFNSLREQKGENIFHVGFQNSVTLPRRVISWGTVVFRHDITNSTNQTLRGAHAS